MAENPVYSPVDAEISVLGAVMLRPDVIDELDLDAADFSSPRNAQMWRCFLDLHRRGLPIDPVTVHEAVQAKPDDWGGRPPNRDEISHLYEFCPSAEPAQQYAALVAEAAYKRRILALLREYGVTAAAGRIDDPRAFAAELIAALHALDEHRSPESGTLGDGMRALLDEIEGRVAAEIGISTGYPALDDVTGGFRRGAVWILGAPEKMGKSTLAANLAANMALAGHCVAFISQEMNRAELTELAVAKLAVINRERLRLRRFATVPDERGSALAAIARHAPPDRSGMADRFQMIDEGSIPAPRVGPLIRRVARRGARAVFLDYLQRVGYPDERGRPQAAVMESFLHQWCSVAKREGVTLALLSQVNRQGKEDKALSLAYKGSGAIEEIADVAARLHWEHLVQPDNPGIMPSHLALKIQRQRFGRSNVTIDLRFYADQGRIEPWLAQASDADRADAAARKYREPTDVSAPAWAEGAGDEPF